MIPCQVMRKHDKRLISILGYICVSGFATPVVNCGTARVPMGLPM